MTRDEVKKLMMVITATYPNYHPENMKHTIDSWYWHFKNDDYNLIGMALIEYDRNNTTGFAPSPGQLLNMARTLTDGDKELTELEAWALVRKAISNSAYNSKEEFDNLPSSLQRAVGSPDNLKEWGTDNNANMTVIQSQFQRSYRGALEQERQQSLLSVDVKKMIAQRTGIMLEDKFNV